MSAMRSGYNFHLDYKTIRRVIRDAPARWGLRVHHPHRTDSPPISCWSIPIYCPPCRARRMDSHQRGIDRLVSSIAFLRLARSWRRASLAFDCPKDKRGHRLRMSHVPLFPIPLQSINAHPPRRKTFAHYPTIYSSQDDCPLLAGSRRGSNGQVRDAGLHV